MEAACLLPYICTDSPGESRQIWVHKYDVDIKVKRPARSSFIPSGLKAPIFSFSDESRARLLHVCRNSGRHIKSQFCLTYHESYPEDGKQVKAHLHAFITYLKRKFGNDTYYLWCLEFQKRGAPHVHFFSSLEPASETGAILAKMWVDIINGGDMCLQFHAHPKNFFAWDMTSGSYLSKEYISKSVQKDVPENFKNVGRFWGNSRNMIPQFTVLNPDEHDPQIAAGIVSAVRIVAKRYCKRTAEIKKVLRDTRRKKNKEEGKPTRISKPNPRKRIVSFTLPTMTALFLTILNANIGTHLIPF